MNEKKIEQKDKIHYKNTQGQRAHCEKIVRDSSCWVPDNFETAVDKTPYEKRNK